MQGGREKLCCARVGVWSIFYFLFFHSKQSYRRRVVRASYIGTGRQTNPKANSLLYIYIYFAPLVWLVCAQWHLRTPANFQSLLRMPLICLTMFDPEKAHATVQFSGAMIEIIQRLSQRSVIGVMGRVDHYFNLMLKGLAACYYWRSSFKSRHCLYFTTLYCSYIY